MGGSGSDATSDYENNDENATVVNVDSDSEAYTTHTAPIQGRTQGGQEQGQEQEQGQGQTQAQRYLPYRLQGPTKKSERTKPKRNSQSYISQLSGKRESASMKSAESDITAITHRTDKQRQILSNYATQLEAHTKQKVCNFCVLRCLQVMVIL